MKPNYKLPEIARQRLADEVERELSLYVKAGGGEGADMVYVLARVLGMVIGSVPSELRDTARHHAYGVIADTLNQMNWQKRGGLII